MAPIATLLNFAIAGTSGYSLYHSQQCFPHLGKCQTQHKADEATAGNTVIAGATMVSYGPLIMKTPTELY